jgi:hypothetical protein
MVEQLTLQTIGILLTGISLTVAAAYYTFTLRNTRRNQELTLETRQTQLFMDIYKTWASKEFQRDLEQMRYIWEFDGFDDFFEKYGVENNPEDHAIWDQAVMWHEGLGVLLRKGLIDPELVDDLMGGHITFFWRRYGPIILEFRDRHNAPLAWKDIDYLHDAIKEIRERKLSSLA